MKPDNTCMRKRFVQEHGTVIDQKLCGHAVRSVNNKIIGSKDIRKIPRMQPLVIGHHRYRGD